MMQVFRNAAKPVIFVLVLTFVVWLVYDLSGLGGNQQGLLTKTAVGAVDGTDIEARVYQNAVQQTSQARQREQSGRVTLEEQRQLENQVWDQFVENILLSKQLEGRGIQVAEEEIVEALKNSPPQAITSAPDFQTDGKFDLVKYQRWLGSSAATPYIDGLAAEYTEQLKRAKLFRQVTAGVLPSDAQVWQRFRDENETVKIRLAAIVARNLPDSGLTVTPAEARAYFDKHRDDFKRSRVAYLSYVTLPRYPNAADTATARDRAAALAKEIRDGAPFAEVAKRESADTASAVKGGELGEWKKGTFAPEFDATAFTIPLNTLSEPVLTQFGYHIIEVTRREGDKATGRHILVPVEVAGTHRDALDKQADELERIGADKTEPRALDAAAKALGLTVERTLPVIEGSRVQIGAVPVPDAGVWAFDQKPGATSNIIETPFVSYLFRLDSLKPAGVPTFDEVKSLAEQAARVEKKQGRARELAQQLAAQVKAGTTLEAAATARGLPVQIFGPFSRVNPPLNNARVVGAAFGVAAGQTSGIIDTRDGLYLVEVLERTPADSAAFQQRLAENRVRGAQQARAEFVQNWIAQLRKNAKVVDEREQVLRQGRQTAGS